jgi:uncharacterized protein YukE
MTDAFRLQPDHLEGLAHDLCAVHEHNLRPALNALRAVDIALSASWEGRAAEAFHRLHAGWADRLAVCGQDLIAIAVFLQTAAGEYRRLDADLHGSLTGPGPAQAGPPGATPTANWVGATADDRYRTLSRGAPYWAIDTKGHLRQLTPAERIAYARARDAQCQLLDWLLETVNLKATGKEGDLTIRVGLQASGQAQTHVNPLGGLNREGAYATTLGVAFGRDTRAGVFAEAALLKSDTQHLLIGDERLGLTLNHGGRAMGVDVFLGGQASPEGGLAAGVSIGATLLSLYAGLGLNLGGRNYSLFAAGGLQARAGAVASTDTVRLDAGPVSLGFEVKDVLDDEPWLVVDPDGLRQQGE